MPPNEGGVLARPTLIQLSTYPGSLSTPVVSVTPYRLHVLRYIVVLDDAPHSLHN